MNTFDKRIQDSEVFIPAIEEGLLETYFSNYDQEFLKTDAGKEDINNNVFKRYNNSLRHVVPWLNNKIDLTGKKVLEIGCGTGSSTAALAHYVRHLQGYDIHSLALAGAKKRLEIMGLNNVKLHIVKEESLTEKITADAEEKYDIVLLYAVLEHQTIIERHDTIKTCWELLADDGIMAIIDTPNILHYFDLHTSKLPFLHMLPGRLYSRYAQHSDRKAFAASFNDETSKSEAELDLQIARWGRGVSYHDFELTLGSDYEKYLIGNGFEPEILSWFPCTVEEELLRWYVEHKQFNIPLGFTRCVLNLIFKKITAPIQNDNLPAFTPPPPIAFDPAPQNIKKMEQKLEEIYRSKTWRAGNLLAAPYRALCRLFKG